MSTTSAAISPLVIGVISIAVMLIVLNAWLCIIAIQRRRTSLLAAKQYRRILISFNQEFDGKIETPGELVYLDHAARQRQWVALAAAGQPTRFSDDWSTSGAASISGSRMTGSVSST